MARLSTCKGCGKKLQSGEKHTYNSKTYCEQCFEGIEKEAIAYKDLVRFICENYNITQPTGFMFKQIKELKNNFGYSYAAMTYTLWYCKEILNKSLLEKYGVSLIKYHYDDAKDYYLQQERMKEQADKLSNVEIKTKVVKKNGANASQRNQASLINLESLLEGGDKH